MLFVEVRYSAAYFRIDWKGRLYWWRGNVRAVAEATSGIHVVYVNNKPVNKRSIKVVIPRLHSAGNPLQWLALTADFAIQTVEKTIDWYLMNNMNLGGVANHGVDARRGVFVTRLYMPYAATTIEFYPASMRYVIKHDGSITNLEIRVNGFKANCVTRMKRWCGIWSTSGFYGWIGYVTCEGIAPPAPLHDPAFVDNYVAPLLRDGSLPGAWTHWMYRRIYGWVLEDKPIANKHGRQVTWP